MVTLIAKQILKLESGLNLVEVVVVVAVVVRIRSFLFPFFLLFLLLLLFRFLDFVNLERNWENVKTLKYSNVVKKSQRKKPNIALLNFEVKSPLALFHFSRREFLSGNVSRYN